MTPTPKLASGAIVRAEAGDRSAPAAEAGPFVLNLCSSTTPMALTQPQTPELKRFSFFVSRRREEGRERFRLHMGYFTTLDEAEEWLNVVRDIYPGAWAGEAPGKKLRERAAAEAAEQAQHIVGPQVSAALPPAAPVRARNDVPTAAAKPAPVVAPVVRAPAAPPARPAAATPPVTKPASKPTPDRLPAVAHQVPSIQAPSMTVPTVHAAAPVPVRAAAPVQTAAAARIAPVASIASTRTAAPSQARAATPITQARLASPVASSPAARPSAQPTARAAHGAAAPHAAQANRPGAVAKPSNTKPSNTKPSKVSFPSSNVREVLAALDDTNETGETRMMPAPAIPRVEASDDSSFTDTQVLRLLEKRRADGSEHSVDDGDTGIALLKPDDTGTRRALKEAVKHNAPVSFAVQLQWSIQPVELDKVPPLAIFSAYTLYTVEGSRDGRKWYGLRLGFFSDAISAKQVAYYVRSEFASVAVVPVSPQERTRASGQDNKSGGLTFAKKTRQVPAEEFKLLDLDDEPAPQPQRAAPKPTPVAARTAPQPPAASRRNAKTAGRVGARDRRAPQTLEETLEILGASELEIDNGRGETLNESGVRHLRVEVQKNTPFGRLLERLSDRVRKS